MPRRAFYGHPTSFRDILQGGVAAPSGSGPFLSAVKKFSARAEAAKLNDRKTDGATVAHIGWGDSARSRAREAADRPTLSIAQTL